jgi:hypothetical protein
MPSMEEGLLYKLLYRLTFYDSDWSSLDGLTIETTNVEVVAMHLRRFRMAQLDRMLCREGEDQPYGMARCAGIEVVHGG